MKCASSLPYKKLDHYSMQQQKHLLHVPSNCTSTNLLNLLPLGLAAPQTVSQLLFFLPYRQDIA